MRVESPSRLRFMFVTLRSSFFYMYMDFLLYIVLICDLEYDHAIIGKVSKGFGDGKSIMYAVNVADSGATYFYHWDRGSL
jgi:hypothetical protein